MSNKRDYYDILGVNRQASTDEIKRSYRKLALKYHPDRTPGDKKAEELFKEATEAYEVLSNSTKRSKYDQFGHEGVGIGSDYDPFQSMRTSDIFQEIFGDFGSFFEFGGKKRSDRRRERGSDLQYNLELTFEQAVFGHSTEITIPRRDMCEACSGSGARNASDMIRCPKCNGTGQVRIQQGFFQMATTCHNCKGEGQIIKEKCKKCSGKGRIKIRKKINVNIPAGVDNDMRIKLSGDGEAGINGGPSGDLYLVIYVKNHIFFERKGIDLHCEIPISITNATLGTVIEVPTLDGSVKLNIPPSTQNNQIFRLKNKGVHNINERNRGNLLVKIIVEIPVKLSNHQKKLLTDFEESLETNSTPIYSKFYNKVKNMFISNEI